MVVQTATSKKVTEKRTGSRRIRGMPMVTSKWSHSCVRFSEAMNNTNLDVMDDIDDWLEKIDDKIEENNIQETPPVIVIVTVTVTLTVDTLGPSPPPARRMTFTGSPKRLLTRVGNFLKTIVTPRRRNRTSIVQVPPEKSPGGRELRTKMKSKYDDICSSLHKDNYNDYDNNDNYYDVDNDINDNNDINPSSSPLPPSSPPRLNRMTSDNSNISQQESDIRSLLDRTKGLIHYCIDDEWKLEELKLLLKNLKLQSNKKLISWLLQLPP